MTHAAGLWWKVALSVSELDTAVAPPATLRLPSLGTKFLWPTACCAALNFIGVCATNESLIF